MANNDRPPDLASILRALQGGSQVIPTQPPSQTPSFLQSLQALQAPRATYPSNDSSLDIYRPAATQASSLSQQYPNPSPLPQAASSPSTLRNQSEASIESSTDARTIIAWSQALRHITRLVARKPEISERIRRLMQAQKDHEAQWWDGRVTLIKQQMERDEGRKKIEEVLRSVGGHVDSSVQGQTPEQDTAEVMRYDAKVHRALSEMERSFRAELEGLCVPFFGTRKDLVVEPGVETRDGKVAQGELKELQRRMIGLLADLCGED